MQSGRTNPLIIISNRVIEVIQQGVQQWMNDLLRDTFNPAELMHLIRSMGVDTSQLASMLGRQPAFDPYMILGLDKSAPDEEIKHRYRKLLHKLHPDTAGVEGTELLLQLVIAAYNQIARERGWQQ